MALAFFPRDRYFWLCHCSATVITGAISFLTAYFWSNLSAIYIAASLVWIAPYSAAVLVFRWLYLHRQWRQIGMGRLIPLVLAYGTLAGLIVAAIVLALVLPFFWDDIVTSQSANSMPFVAHDYLFRRVVGDGLQGQLFICAWIFIYISITSSRHIRQVDLVNLRLQNSLKEAQLSSLANQLNPHFLFNTLNNIRFMMHENVAQADHMIVALSDILRYSLASSAQEKVRLSEELNIVERYLAVIRTQLENRLSVSIDIPRALHTALVPPMIVHLLVENAIKHGLDQLYQGGKLSISACEHERKLVLTLVNDMPSTSVESRPGMGIGLSNIERRLHLLYGHNASLESRVEAGQFIVVLTLPKEFVP